jgi:hypothetical protein
MLRKVLCLVVVVGVGGLAAGQTKDKGKDKDVKKVFVKATVAKVDVDKRMLWVTLEGGKKAEYVITKEVKFYGPRGGVRDKGIKDEVLAPGAEVRLVYDTTGKVLKEVHLPFRKKPVKDKTKDKK